mgnify:FL=1
MEQAQKTFSYVARDASGARQSGVVSGLDTNDATRVLRAQGLFPISLDIDDGSSAPRAGARKPKDGAHLSPRQTSDFLTRLAKLSGRQIQTERALAIIGDGGQDPISRAAARVRDSLREGAALSQALEEKAGVDDPVTLSLV